MRRALTLCVLIGILDIATPKTKIRDSIINEDYFLHATKHKLFAEFYTDNGLMPDSVKIDETYRRVKDDTTEIENTSWILLKPDEKNKSYAEVRRESNGYVMHLKMRDFYAQCTPEEMLRALLKY